MPEVHTTSTNPFSSWRRFLPKLRILGLAILVVLGLGATVEAIRVLAGKNIHELVPGRVYRGAQLSPPQLENLVHAYGIRTVVNLRGCCDSFSWYLDQCRVIQEQEIAQEDICFSAGRLPSMHEIRRLVEVLEEAEYPLYLHCRRGADRTGLASVIALLLLTETPLAVALRQLGVRYGHFAVGRTRFLDQFFDLYSDWLRDHQRQHSRNAFRHWVLNEYQGGWCNYRMEKFEPMSGTPGCDLPCAYRVRVRNTGPQTWRLGPANYAGMHLIYNLWDDQGQSVSTGRSAMLEKEVAPGQAIDLTLILPPFPRPGRYRLMLDMVEENHCLFFQTGTEPLEEELEVRE